MTLETLYLHIGAYIVGTFGQLNEVGRDMFSAYKILDHQVGWVIYSAHSTSNAVLLQQLKACYNSSPYIDIKEKYTSTCNCCEVMAKRALIIIVIYENKINNNIYNNSNIINNDNNNNK